MAGWLAPPLCLDMKKIKFGKKLLGIIGFGMLYSAFLFVYGVKELQPESPPFTILTLSIAAISGCAAMVLGFWTISDCLDNLKKFKRPKAEFFALVLFNWGAAVLYYFVVIVPREKASA